MVTLKDISVKCKCSVATVSKALNGMPDIGEETARHIRQVATRMGYTPNAAARTLKTNRSQTIGLLMCQRDENIWTHDFFSRVAAGIQEVMEGSGYDVTPAPAHGGGAAAILRLSEIRRHYHHERRFPSGGNAGNSGKQAAYDIH